jgi:epoxyqueuosine reductase
LRNIAVALGNAPASDETLALLQKKQAEIVSVLVQEHIQWAVDQHKQGASS